MNTTATAEDLRNIMIEDGNAPADVDIVGLYRLLSA